LPIDAKVGMIDEAKWNYTKAFYVESGMLKGTKPVSQAYTTQFIDKCNDFDRKTVADDFKRYQDSIR
ncbi:MAG: NitT/TauT family transport system substrate-binding protein, partial [Rhizobacter sp.]|nr:NitT/TauT family transport system substrate-binding protein [Rhizobacter sp.]